MDTVIIAPANKNPFGVITSYYIVECPTYIKEEVWGNVSKLGDVSQDVSQFDFTWSSKLQESCQRHNIEIRCL